MDMATQTEPVTETISATAKPPSIPADSPEKVVVRKKLAFQDLPRDIKEHVVDKLIRPLDLRAACLVNKEFHEVAVRPLYRNVALDLGSPNDTRLSAFLNPRNIGLKHIRRLRLYLATVYDKCNQEQQAHFATRMLLEFLPENILEEFSWCPWRPFSAENLILLYKKQRKMKWLEVMDLDRDVLPDLKKNPRIRETLFSHVRKLALYPENRVTLNLSGYFVEHTKDKLEELIVHCNFLSLGDRDSLENRELNDSATGAGLLSNTIFSCMTPFDQCKPFSNLTLLRLHRINLRHCEDTWCKFINFQKLEDLRLYHCSGADTLFGQLSKARHLPRCLKALEFQHRDNSDNEALIALDGLLCLVSGIRTLVIDLEHTKSLPSAAGIAKHGKTLELLNVHCAPESHATSITLADSDGEELVWDNEEFEKICTSCPHLEQLSCAWPPTSLIRTPSDQWKVFEHACSNLRKLVTLHVTTWPTNKPSTQLLPRAVYETMLQALALRGFELAVGTHSSSPPPSPGSSDDGNNDASTEEEEDLSPKPPAKLRIIAFGTSDKIYEREDSKNQIIYLRSSCVDAHGRTQVHATPIGWCLRQFVEPRSEVLDFVLHQSDRSNKPPCREHRDSTAQHDWGEDEDLV